MTGQAHAAAWLWHQRPAWLDAAHQVIDSAVAAVGGWAACMPGMPDEEMLQRLLALSLARAGA